MESFATSYPLIFFDGEQEHDRGYTGIHSVLTFKRFRSLLSQKTGIPPNQLSIVFICRRMQNDVEKRHRLPINGNTNFNILLSQHNPSKEKDCYFFVTVKKSKKERSKGSRKRGAEDGWEHSSSKGDPFLVEESSHMTGTVLGEMMLQDPGSSQYPEAHISSPFTGSSFEHGGPYGRMQINGTSADKILLNRANVASLPRGRWIYPEQQVPVVQRAKLFMDDEFGYMQSPRFAALQQEERVYEWSTQDSFLMETNRLQGPYFTPYHNGQRNASDYHHNVYIQNHCGDKVADGPSDLNMDLHRGGVVRKFNFSKAGLLSSRVTALPTLDGLNCPESRKPKRSVPAIWGSFADYQSPQKVVNRLEEVSCHICLDCKSKNICPIPFHWCVGDIVTEGFQGPSPAGPIGRPSKPLVQT